MTTASAADPCASNIRPRCRRGSADETRTAFAFVSAASASAPCDSAARRTGRIRDLDDERDAVALRDRLTELGHETGS